MGGHPWRNGQGVHPFSRGPAQAPARGVHACQAWLAFLRCAPPHLALSVTNRLGCFVLDEFSQVCLLLPVPATGRKCISEHTVDGDPWLFRRSDSEEVARAESRGEPVLAVVDAPVGQGPSPAAAAQRHARTSHPLAPPGLRVVTYNVLADQYAATEYAQQHLFSYCPPWYGPIYWNVLYIGADRCQPLVPAYLPHSAISTECPCRSISIVLETILAEGSSERPSGVDAAGSWRPSTGGRW